VKSDVTHLAGPLWIGSHPLTANQCCDEHDGKARFLDQLAREGFEVVVLCAEEWQHKIPGVETIHAPFDDDHRGLDAEQSETAFKAAEKTAHRLLEGRKTLVTCWAGRNRSGLVCALALSAVTGRHPSEAGELVRAKRNGALTNMAFRGILSRAKTCELCEAKPVTKRYHEDAICWIADCKQCKVPMVVYREHGVLPPPGHLKHMIDTLTLCGKPRRGGYVIDDSMNTIPDHWHAHLRPA
jgi:hypothetical protein